MESVNFKFGLGDLVFFRGAQHTAGHIPRQFVIYEVICRYCDGGTYKEYRLGGYPEAVPEILLSREEPPYRASVSGFQDRLTSV